MSRQPLKLSYGSPKAALIPLLHVGKRNSYSGPTAQKFPSGPPPTTSHPMGRETVGSRYTLLKPTSSSNPHSDSWDPAISCLEAPNLLIGLLLAFLGRVFLRKTVSVCSPRPGGCQGPLFRWRGPRWPVSARGPSCRGGVMRNAHPCHPSRQELQGVRGFDIQIWPPGHNDSSSVWTRGEKRYDITAH